MGSCRSLISLWARPLHASSRQEVHYAIKKYLSIFVEQSL